MMALMSEDNNFDVRIEELSAGRHKISVESKRDVFIPIRTCETSYPVELINNILSIKGPAYLCDEISREESSAYVQSALKYDIFGYIREEEFHNKRLLDFGCGSGASTMILARMFPNTQIVGIELEERLLAIAQLRAAHYGYGNIERLVVSESPDVLPSDLGEFDYVVLSAVYEHLLPCERTTVLSQIWSLLKPGGVLFLDQTPYRHFPVELHTTGGLPLINYLPDKLALVYAHRFSKRNLDNHSWKELLRMGIRGGSVKEILGILGGLDEKPVLLVPCRLGLQDRIDLWYIQCGKVKYAGAKRLFASLAKLLQRLTSVTVVPDLSLAIQKAE